MNTAVNLGQTAMSPSNTAIQSAESIQHKPTTQWRNPSIDQAISGFTAGAVSTAILHPLDLVKTRFQGILFDSSCVSMLFNGNDIDVDSVTLNRISVCVAFIAAVDYQADGCV